MSLAFIKVAQHSVHPTDGSQRVFRQFAWLGIGSVKMALSRPTHLRVTPAVRRLGIFKSFKVEDEQNHVDPFLAVVRARLTGGHFPVLARSLYREGVQSFSI
jgi:hypothetical protein